ncbi:hypothetical protein RRG08_038668 [Elysia crispata]|uniref:Uncharacterized protein n=1 Tax=Elysia crispata TaxID=231223 RepID=A0AAE0ZJ43_9GAST|nr:hypothetical protein RRG08_038668 [Elysia crispata]
MNFPKKLAFGIRSFPANIGGNVQCLSNASRKGLPKPYKAYKNRHCEDTASPYFVNPLKRYSHYTAANCLEECSVDRMVNLCGCRAFNDAGNDTICSSLKMLTCYIPNKFNQTAAALAKNRSSTLENCDCPEECDMVTYTAALSYADFSSRFEQLQLTKSNIYPNIRDLRMSFINLRIYFETMSVDTLRQEPAVSILDILGTVGGQMGIFLGCSILSIIELIEMGLLISIRCTWEIYYTLFRSSNSRIASLGKKAAEMTSPWRLPSQQKKQDGINQGSQTKPLM